MFHWLSNTSFLSHVTLPESRFCHRQQNQPTPINHPTQLYYQTLCGLSGALSMVPIPDSLAEQLCERLLSVLFEIWLLACGRCFPSPTLWRTLTTMCATWRHHAATVEQWNRINKVLTSRLLKILYGPEFPPLVIGNSLFIWSKKMSDSHLSFV